MDAGTVAAGQSLPVAPAMERAAPEFPAKPADASGTLDQAHFLDNIVRQARLLTRPDGARELTLNLQPPELGTVVIRLTLKNDHLQGQIQADSQATRESLQSLIPAVKQSLAGDGINLDRLDVGPRGQQAHSAGSAAQGGAGGAFGDPHGRPAPQPGSPASLREAPRSQSVPRRNETVSSDAGVLSSRRASAWVGVMDFVA
jgi:flagellar hook-length control protein FliK